MYHLHFDFFSNVSFKILIYEHLFPLKKKATTTNNDIILLSDISYLGYGGPNLTLT